MVRILTRAALVLGIIGFVLCLSLSGAYAETVQLTNILSEENAALCEEESPSDASATLSFTQDDGETWLTISLADARPNALFSVWLLLDGTSPLTGASPEPMVPSDLVEDLVAVTPPLGSDFGLNGVDEDGDPIFKATDGDTTVYMDSTGPTGPGFGTRSLVLNGFFTDNSGTGMFERHLDFELVGGAYPFDKVKIPARVKLGELDPVDIRVPPNPAFAVVSHCKDEKGHGLVFRRDNVETGDQAWFLFFPPE